MNKYRVTIKETLKTDITVEAEDYYAAIDKARDMYRNEEIVLTADDYFDTDFEAKYLDQTKEKASTEREER